MGIRGSVELVIQIENKWSEIQSLIQELKNIATEPCNMLGLSLKEVKFPYYRLASEFILSCMVADKDRWVLKRDEATYKAKDSPTVDLIPFFYLGPFNNIKLEVTGCSVVYFPKNSNEIAPAISGFKEADNFATKIHFAIAEVPLLVVEYFNELQPIWELFELPMTNCPAGSWGHQFYRERGKDVIQVKLLSDKIKTPANSDVSELFGLDKSSVPVSVFAPPELKNAHGYKSAYEVAKDKASLEAIIKQLELHKDIIEELLQGE